MGRSGQRAVQRHDVAALEEFVEFDVLDAEVGEMSVLVRIDGQHVTAEMPQQSGDDRADLPGADHADGSSGEVEPDESDE